MTTDSPSLSNFSPFLDLTKTFEQFKLPGMDMAGFVEARRKDVAAMVAANQVAFDAMQSLAHTQSDMLTQAMQGLQASTQTMMAGGNPATGLAGQTEAAQKAWQKMLADMQELAERVRQAQADAVAGLTERARENMAAASGPVRAA